MLSLSFKGGVVAGCPQVLAAALYTSPLPNKWMIFLFKKNFFNFFTIRPSV